MTDPSQRDSCTYDLHPSLWTLWQIKIGFQEIIADHLFRGTLKGQYAILEKPTNILQTRSHKENMRIVHEIYIQTLMDSLADLNWFPENN